MVVASNDAVLTRWFALADFVGGRVLLGPIGRVVLEAVDVCVTGWLRIYILLKVTGEAEFDLAELLDRPCSRITFFLTTSIGSRSFTSIGIVKEAVDILLSLRDGRTLHTKQELVYDDITLIAMEIC